MIRKVTNRVIFHHSLSASGSVEEITKWHQARGFDTIGYHYVIQPNGFVEVGRDVEEVGAHASGENSDSIGICLIGDFTKTVPTDEQLNSALHLFGILSLEYPNVKAQFHHELCPGWKLDRVKFMEMLTK
jgi:N-acetylmuramoyl-L-alanine amidase